MKKSKIDLKFEKINGKASDKMRGTGAPKKKSTRKVKRVKKK